MISRAIARLYFRAAMMTQPLVKRQPQCCREAQVLRLYIFDGVNGNALFVYYL